MARPKLSSSQQPLLLRVMLRIFEFAASLKLAVVLLSLLVVVLGWATFIEAEYGTPSVQYFAYGTWWFTILGCALAVNIFSAAAIRFPFKRHQTGFVITHVGLLTLLFGCYLNRRGGIDAQMPLLEGTSGNIAYEDTAHVILDVAQNDPAKKEALRIAIPFDGGPFNWSKFDKLKLHEQFMLLVHKGPHTLYDEDGIRVEVLDYYANCVELPTPLLKLGLSSPPRQSTDDNGKPIEVPGEASEIMLAIEPSVNPSGWHKRPSKRERIGGGTIVFMLAKTPEEQAHFEDSAPDVPIGSKGQVVLHVGGKRHVLPVAEMLGQEPSPLEGTDYQVQVLEQYTQATISPDSTETELRLMESPSPGQPLPAAVLKVIPKEGQPMRMVLFADQPELNFQDDTRLIYASYWFDRGQQTEAERMQGMSASRIDILQGQDEKLYYRYFNRTEVLEKGLLPLNGDKVNAFQMRVAKLQMWVNEFVPSKQPSTTIEPLPFRKDNQIAGNTRAARLRITLDDSAPQEVWVLGPPIQLKQDATGSRMITGKTRSMVVSMPLDEVDVGFLVHLEDFEQMLDPGTSMPWNYTSYVKFLDKEKATPLLDERITITMNAPVDFSADQGKVLFTHKYRLFQESFSGPFLPDSPQYQIAARQWPQGMPLPAKIEMSILTVNYSPGRAVVYLGCALVVGGIFTMFYMRAYFFKRPQKPQPTKKQPPADVAKPKKRAVPVGS